MSHRIARPSIIILFAFSESRPVGGPTPAIGRGEAPRWFSAGIPRCLPTMEEVHK